MSNRVIVSPSDSLPIPSNTMLLVPDANLITGIPELTKEMGPLTSLETDLMTVAAAIFAVDLAVKRGEREGFTRDLEVTIPLVNYQSIARLEDELREILYILSHDNWTFRFIQTDGIQERNLLWPESSGRTLLFSGGLDSLAAAAEELGANNYLRLASHYTYSRTVRTSQRALHDYLSGVFGERVSWTAARVTGRSSGSLSFPPDDKREPSQRTRSFMFLIIGAIAARRSGHHEILMIAENGQMAIHLPMTAARIGAFSTHTAHPQFVHQMEHFLSSVLGFPIVLKNPYLYRTKAEAISSLVRNHPKIIAESVSCWRSSRTAYAHCGACLPCLVRRIALECNGLPLREYGRDLLNEDISTLPPDDVGKRNLVELAEFVMWFGGAHSNAKLLEMFPDLVNDYIELDKAVDMYRRFASEARSVLENYPNVRSIIA